MVLLRFQVVSSNPFYRRPVGPFAFTQKKVRYRSALLSTMSFGVAARCRATRENTSGAPPRGTPTRATPGSVQCSRARPDPGEGCSCPVRQREALEAAGEALSRPGGQAERRGARGLAHLPGPG